MIAAGRPVRTLLLYSASEANRTLSYQQGWPAQFARHARFGCTAVNVSDRRARVFALARLSARHRRFDAVVLLHSAFSNSRELDGRLFERICTLPQPKAFFIGNEYKLMPQKIAFAEELGVRLLVTMNPSLRAQALYRERLRCEVTCIPSAGLDTELFRPGPPREERPIDLGYRGFEAPLYLGHDERRRIVAHFVHEAPRYGLAVDISTDPAARLEGPEWAAFLARCKGHIGTEAGTDYFEFDDSTRLRVNAYLDERPEAGFDEVWERFFAGYESPVSARMISGRQVEAAGTKTVQILFEGLYSGYFEPGVHYIPLRKDLSDAGEAVERFRDVDLCRRITEAAYDVAMTELTYERLIDRFHGALTGVL